MATKFLPIGAGLPVVPFAVLITLGATRIGTAFNKIGVFEKRVRRITAVAFTPVGIHYSQIYIFVLRIQEIVFQRVPPVVK